MRSDFGKLFKNFGRMLNLGGVLLIKLSKMFFGLLRHFAVHSMFEVQKSLPHFAIKIF